MTLLHCAACGAEMTEAEARPGSAEMVPELRFHAQLQGCTDVIMPRYWERRAQDSRRAVIVAQEPVERP